MRADAAFEHKMIAARYSHTCALLWSDMLYHLVSQHLLWVYTQDDGLEGLRTVSYVLTP